MVRSIAFPVLLPFVFFQLAATAGQRQSEALDRGIVAMKLADGRAYVGWRLLSADPPDVAFNVYRSVDGSGEKKRNAAPIMQSTDFIDGEVPDDGDVRYWVRPIIEGNEAAASGSSPFRNPSGEPYIALPLNGDHTFQKVGIADLNGDGRYDFVIKQPNVNIDPDPRAWVSSEGTYKIEAYLHDGTFLWRNDLGWSIEQGIWFSPYVVYDFDGDGKAEVAVKTGEGDPRNEKKQVRTGPEYLSIWDGMTGEEKSRVAWPDREGFFIFDFFSRNQLGVAYLDGEHPALIVARGTYSVMKCEAYRYAGASLSKLWAWDSRNEGPPYSGQGAHFMHAADVDNDGKDEVILGSCVLDDTGKGLWSNGKRHCDHCYVGDIDPARPGFEIYYGYEIPQDRDGVCLADAATGQILWGIDTSTRHVHGQGLCSDISAAYSGMECYSGEQQHPQRWLHAADGTLLKTGKDLDWGHAPQALFWNGDAQRELLHEGRIFDYDDGTVHLEGLPGHYAAWADVIGDWREEIIVSMPGEVRIYTTTIPAASRHTCLMEDPIYRIDVAHLAMGYAQPPMLARGLSSR